MKFNVSQIVVMFLLMLITGGMVRFFAPEKVVYQTSKQQKKLDSLTVLSENLRINRKQIEDSLKHTSKAFRKYIHKTKNKLASYSHITAKLRLSLDTLKSKAATVDISDIGYIDSLNHHRLKDTTISSSSLWGNGLIKATARSGIRNNKLFLDPPMVTELRRPHIDIGVTLENHNSGAQTVVTSPDFVDMKVVSYTPLHPHHRFPWWEITATIGFVIGYAL